MSNIIKNLFLVLLCSTLLYAQKSKEVSKKELNTINNLNLIKQSGITISKAYDLGSIFVLDATIQGHAHQELFLTKDKKVVFSGNAINTKNGDNYTLPIDLSNILGKEAFTFGSGKDEYILFTDPECPYCKKFESYFSQIEKDVKIRIFLFPLSYHKNAKELSLYYMSKKTKKEKVDALLNVTAQSAEFKNRKYDDAEYAKLEKRLNEQINAAKKLNVSATPTMYDINGKKVSWVEILQKKGIKVNF
ncbi:thioredoxin fold domain-containing protein [Arcobacter sp. CECT 8985]|uniref:thioredoxin fold domain-containing protein n=1 Tax=Arcobacter sp. CECT 8985 TaxID=1935424 RepID=UPI00100B3B99|nr:thioredoxin fold domain-containing protein [Arcobacter sp. CECT 8985]RXJ86516.1 thiol:disulfide interchange protein [Arcobacter sp. CECT 8985]